MTNMQFRARRRSAAHQPPVLGETPQRSHGGLGVIATANFFCSLLGSTAKLTTNDGHSTRLKTYFSTPRRS